jgi:hypothetical protein
LHQFDGTYPLDMEPVGIEEALSAGEAATNRGASLVGTGFWHAVARVKTDSELIERYADRIAVIDQAAFRNWALVVVPNGIGTIMMSLATVVGVMLIGYAYNFTDLLAVLAFYIGFGIVLTTSHGLGHLIVGRVSGIRFTSWFIGTIGRPQPGVKVDYASYLRTSSSRRAWMHASGALVTKILPFTLIGAAVAAGLAWWAVWALPLIGLVAIATDVVWSTKKSDWKKFQREMRFAHKS